MTNHNFIPSLVALVAVTASLNSCVAKPSKPNVVMIMCDDLGWGDVGFNGNTIIKTPNLDRLAGNGIIFNRFYTASAVSSPTRASVLTGRNPHRTGVNTANVGILRTEEITIPELLQEEGYRTGHFGKWHLGTLTNTEKDGVRAKNGNNRFYNPPKLHGYDDSFTTEAKVPTWDPMLKPAGMSGFPAGWDYIKKGDETEYAGTAYWTHDGKRETKNLRGDDSRVIMDRVIPFIEKSQSQEQPFLAVVWFHTPHKPCVAGADYAAMYKDYNDDFKNYAGCITAMDDQVGRLYDFLEEQGIADNTMIWFSSDNGPEECSPNGGGVTGGFRNRKRSLHEGGVRVPTFMHWGDEIKKGFRTDYLLSTNDLLPTVTTAVGVSPQKWVNELDGVDVSEVFTNKKAERTEPVITIFDGQATYSDNRYKIYLKGGVIECYDIMDDPYERNPNANIPDLEHKIEAINDKIESFKSSYLGGGYKNSPIEVLAKKWNPDFAPNMAQYNDVEQALNISQRKVVTATNNCISSQKGAFVTSESPTYDAELQVVDIELSNRGDKRSGALEVRVLYNDRTLVSSAIEPIKPNETMTISLPLLAHPKFIRFGYEVILYDKGVEHNRVQFF